MQRIPSLLKKIADLCEKEDLAAIDIDLMLDYTRVIYADLLEQKTRSVSAIPADVHPIPAPLAVTVDDTLNDFPKIPSIRIPAGEAQRVAGPPTDIKELVSVNDKYQFITELFQGNRSAYEKVMDNLNKFETALQAQNWLHSRVFNQYNWDEDSDAVQTFYDIINQFFADR